MLLPRLTVLELSCWGHAYQFMRSLPARFAVMVQISFTTAKTCHVSMCRSTLFGPTCDGLDTIVREHPLPFLRNGDWIVFPNMGAYSIAGAVNFNGFHVADAPFFYICSEA